MKSALNMLLHSIRGSSARSIGQDVRRQVHKASNDPFDDPDNVTLENDDRRPAIDLRTIQD